jgi:hypothetical protein
MFHTQLALEYIETLTSMDAESGFHTRRVASIHSRKALSNLLLLLFL